MEGLAAIDEELDGLAQDRDLEPIAAEAHASLPDRGEGLGGIDALLAELGEAVTIPTVEPVGVSIPRPEIHLSSPSLPPVHGDPTLDSAAMVRSEPPVVQETEAPADSGEAAEAPAAATEAPADSGEAADPPPATGGQAERARAADAEVDAVVAESPSSSGGLSAESLFGDMDEDEALFGGVFTKSEPPDDDVAEAAPADATTPPAKPPTMPPPPPAEARADVEEIDIEDLDDLLIDDDSFELMIDDEDDDTFIGDAAAVEAAAAAAAARDAAAAEASGESAEGAAAEPAGEEEDDAREQSFFKKLFG